jgi:hypothetical protein
MPFDLQAFRSFFGFSDTRKGQIISIDAKIAPVVSIGHRVRVVSSMRKITNVVVTKVLQAPVGEKLTVKAISFMRLNGTGVPSYLLVQSDSVTRVRLDEVFKADGTEFCCSLRTPISISGEVYLAVVTSGAVSDFNINILTEAHPDV